MLRRNLRLSSYAAAGAVDAAGPAGAAGRDVRITAAVPGTDDLLRDRPVTVRAERPSDERAVDGVVRAAFGRPDEAALVAALRRDARPFVSLVADREGSLIGHVACSPVTLDGRPLGMGLAPVAVHPAHQRRGVGAALVRTALAACRDLGQRVVVVLGEPAYYARFGFRPAALAERRGRVRYHPAGDGL